MTLSSEEFTEKMHQHLRYVVSDHDDFADSVVVRWVVVMDFLHPDGTRTLTRFIGPTGTQVWEADGMTASMEGLGLEWRDVEEET